VGDVIRVVGELFCIVGDVIRVVGELSCDVGSTIRVVKKVLCIVGELVCATGLRERGGGGGTLNCLDALFETMGRLGESEFCI